MRRKARKVGAVQIEVTVARMGARGDGLAEHLGRPLFVAGSLADERVLVQITGERAGGFKGSLQEMLAASPERQNPPCPHAGTCGGCSLQHWKDAPYQAWKEALLSEALARRSLVPERQNPFVAISAGSRRRADIAFENRAGQLLLGFHERESRRIIDLSDCLQLTPTLTGFQPTLRRFLAAIVPSGGAGEAALLESDCGIDLLLCGLPPPDRPLLEAAAALAANSQVTRISWAASRNDEPELLVQPRAPQITLSGIAVIPAPGAFLQPSAAGEAALVAKVQAAAGAAEELPATRRRALDLHAGCGTFSFALATSGWRVEAYEGLGRAVTSLNTAAHSTRGLSIAARERDLARQPLMAADLAGFDLLVFDPPRAGAREQAEEIARSEVPRVVAVSCNPATFARDARILVEGGYRLKEITPIDQFPWSGHLELVAGFEKQAT